MTDLAAAKTLSWDIADPAHALTMPSRFFYDAGVFAAARSVMQCLLLAPG